MIGNQTHGNQVHCSKCGKLMGPHNDFCIYCGEPSLKDATGQVCTNPRCERSRDGTVFPPNALYCGTCGKPTTDQRPSY
ncbi:MAG: hypothetical protein LBH95_04965 [Oscillospiraceae bacterium]|jgi:uncharacterized OB-fold protein|nr:hypothetical protein [Oscillospiraceae bacterium]